MEDRRINEFINKIAELKIRAQQIYIELSKITNPNELTYEIKDKIYKLGRITGDIIYYQERVEMLKGRSSNLDEKKQKNPKDYSIQSTKKDLANQKRVLEEKIKKMKEALRTIENNFVLTPVVEELELNISKYERQIKAITQRLNMYEKGPDLTDEEIDIYIQNDPNNISFHGTIYLHGKDIEIGNIEYRGPVDSKWLGDIGYHIEREFNGHNYAYKALQLISSLIAAKGIEKVTITTYKDNIASVKTIEKFGGVLSDNTLDDVASYTCYIKPILDTTNNIKK